MEQVSVILETAFIACTGFVLWQFYKASHGSKIFLRVALFIALVQFVIGSTNFYENGTTLPPRFILLIVPGFLILFYLLATKKGRQFMDNLNLGQLTLLHTVRIPVELVLYYLFMAKTIPQVMTFEGRNFDILVGLTAPLVYYFGFYRKTLSSNLLILWNVFGMVLLFNIIIIAILSAKSPLQQFGFDQPNLAMGHWPFNWLPSIVVPLVMLSHISSIRQLWALRKVAHN
jgi:hypothetical protein